jgi:hypothetical protein
MRYAALFLAVLLHFSGAEVHAEIEAGELRSLLGHLQADGLWGEATFAGGRVRSLKVEHVGEDSVSVTEIFGPLQHQAATYALADFNSLRELGPQRIQSRHAAYRSSKSMLSALFLETGFGAVGADGSCRGHRDRYGGRWGGWLGAALGLDQGRIALPFA